MLSAVLTAFLLGMLLLIICSFIFGAFRERQRHMRSQAAQKQDAAQSNTGSMMVMVQLLDGNVVAVEQPVLATPPPPFTLPHAWYLRRRVLISLCLLAMALVTLLVQSGLADGALQGLTQDINFLNFAQHTSGVDIQTISHPLPATASSRIIRIDSALRDQYYTNYQWQVWSYSSCSGISLEEVMNSYGRHYIAADVLQVEQNMGIWNVAQGLTAGESGLARAAAYFGFQASPHPPRTLTDLIRVANQGTPVIVGIPGHILVVRGGDSTYVYLVDSAPANRKMLTHQQFSNIWDGFSVLITPR